MIKIIAVSYLNTIPFVYGLQHFRQTDDFELQLEIPSICAAKFIENEVDIALLPVAVLPKLKNFDIISDYCIGAKGKVRTVCLFSQVPLKNITSVLLDFHSLTSVNLVKILTRDFWKIQPEWIEMKSKQNTEMSVYESIVAIGDKVFELEKKYAYCYDLAEEWIKFTGLPFVFACWVSNKNASPGFIHQFNKALQFGVENIPLVIQDYRQSNPTEINLKEYYQKNISFDFDKQKKLGLNRFLELLID
jgi:chorismate dehydratase